MGVERNQVMEVVVLTLTYLCMVSRHSAIEGWYMSKSSVHKHASMTTSWLAAMDSVYLFCYATGNVISGYLEDRFPLRFLISGGLACSGLLYILIIAMGIADNYLPYLFLLHWAMQGLFQSTVWPGCVAVLGNWLTKNHRGKVMGFWCSCGSVGNIVGALIGGVILNAGQEWTFMMGTFAVFQGVMAVLYVSFVSDSPIASRNELLDDGGTSVLSVNAYEGITPLDKPKEALPFIDALRLPGVVAFSLNFACLKSLYYGLSMWLPFFLKNRIDHPELIGVLAASLNVGAVIGSIVCGMIGDMMKFRSPIITCFMVISLPLILLLEFGNSQIYWLYFIVIPLTGFFIAGCSNIVASAVAADLSQNENIDKNAEAMATVAGIIDGAGGLGAAISTFIMGSLSIIDWAYVFVFMFLLVVLGILVIVPITYRDFKKFRQNRRVVKVETQDVY